MYDTDVTVWSPEGRLLQVRNHPHLMFMCNWYLLSSIIIDADTLFIYMNMIICNTIQYNIIHFARSNMPWNQ